MRAVAGWSATAAMVAAVASPAVAVAAAWEVVAKARGAKAVAATETEMAQRVVALVATEVAGREGVAQVAAE